MPGFSPEKEKFKSFKIIGYQVLANCEMYDSIYLHIKYRISSYKTLPRIIPAILIIPAFLIILCSENVVFSNKTRIWRLYEIIIPAGLICGSTVLKQNKRNTNSILTLAFQEITHLQIHCQSMPQRFLHWENQLSSCS